MFKLFGFIQETSAQNVNGIGLGLMISKQIVEQYEGLIWVESEPEIGSTFTFKLKFMQEEIDVNQIQIVAPKYNYKFEWRPLDDQPVFYINDIDNDNDFGDNKEIFDDTIEVI